jgi:hypothetical protein
MSPKENQGKFYQNFELLMETNTNCKECLHALQQQQQQQQQAHHPTSSVGNP